jgi:serine protease Do
MSLTLTVHMVHRKDTGACTAVWISPTEAISAGHCIHNEKDKLFIKDDTGHSYIAYLEKVDHQLDLSLLKINAPEHPYAHLGHVVKRGDHIFVMTSGEDIANTYGEGVVANIFNDPENGTLSILHTAAILPGASGSGLFDSRGRLVGVNTAIYKNLSSAVDITAVEDFLNGKHH